MNEDMLISNMFLCIGLLFAILAKSTYTKLNSGRKNK